MLMARAERRDPDGGTIRGARTARGEDRECSTSGARAREGATAKGGGGNDDVAVVITRTDLTKVCEAGGGGDARGRAPDAG